MSFDAVSETLADQWDTSCTDWKERLLDGRSLVPDLPLFQEEVDRALRVFKRLRIPDVHGTPTLGEACGEWFFPIVAALFGSYDVAANRRMIQELFLLIPKKNSKSSYGGALMVAAMILNRRRFAEFLLVAPTKEIADIAYKQARNTIGLDPELEKLFHAQRHIRLLTHRNSGASLQIKAADTDVITGGKQLGTMIDETHVFSEKSNAADIFVEIRGALASRPDGFLFQTTTQSKKAPSGVFLAELNMARGVRDGSIQLPLLPILYELPLELAENDGWKKEVYWPLVNPNLGRSVDLTFLRNELRKAEVKVAGDMQLYASQHHNVEIGLALQSNNWAGAEFWPAAADRTLTFDELLRRCEVIVVGIDGGGLDDLLGLAVMGREIGTGRWLLWSHAWAHEIVKQRRKSIAPKLDDFASPALGQLTFVKRPGEDVEQAADIVVKIEKAGKLASDDAIGVDSFGVTDIVKALTAPERGIAMERIVGISQGWQLSGAIKTAERNLAGGTLIHAGLELMDFAVGNARVEPRGNALSITKQASGSAKIDPLMAMFNTVVLMGKNPTAGSRSIYEERGLRVA